MGGIKGTDKLIPVLDIVFNEYGVKFGWAGSQAVLYSDIKALSDREVYISFLKKIAELSIPEMIKKPQNLKIEEQNEEIVEDAKNATEIEVSGEKEAKKVSVFFRKAKKVLTTGTETVEKAGGLLADKVGDVFRDRNAVRRQQLFYGV